MHRNLFFLTQELEPRPAWDSNIRGLNLQTEKHFIKIRWCWLGWIHTSSDCQTDTEMKGASWIYLLHLWVSAFIRSIFVSYCIYSICEYDSDYSVKFFDGRCPQTFPILRGGRSIRPRCNKFWYFPNQSCRVDSLCED